MRCRLSPACGAWVALLCAAAGALHGQTYPGWWGNYGIVTAAIPSASNTTLYNAWVAQNYLPANLGQLKNFATQAQAYLDDNLASIGGAGPGIGNIVANFTVSSPFNFSPVNFGQIKAVAQPIYDRLYQVGFSANVGLAANYGFSGNWTWSTNPYPWPPPPPSSGNIGYDETTYNAWVAQNYLPANLGQLKAVFSFDGLSTFTPAANLSIAGDGIPDWWKVLNGLSPFGGNLAGNTDFGDGRTDLQEYQFYFNVYNSTVGGAGNVSGFETADTTESTTFPTVPANYTADSIVFPRQPVPQYAVVDLGWPNARVMDLNNSGQALLIDYSGDYALWSGGTLYYPPTTDGDYTYEWLTLAEDGTVMGIYFSSDDSGFANWTIAGGVGQISQMAAASEFVSGNFTDVYDIEDSYLVQHGAIFEGVGLDETMDSGYENQNLDSDDGDGDCVLGTPTPVTYNDTYSMMLRYNSDNTVTQFGDIVFNGKDGDYATGDSFAIAYNVATTPQGDTLAVEFTGNYTTAPSEPQPYISGYDEDCNPITSYFTYTVRYPDSTTLASNLYLDGVLLPNPSDSYAAFIWPPIPPINADIKPQGLANTTTGPVLLDPYRYTEGAPASVDAVVNGSLVQANLTASGAPAAVSALNGLGLGLGPDGDGDSLGPLWLNGAALQDQDILSAGDLNPDLTLNVAALLPGSSLSGNATLAITNLASQTTLAAGQVTDGAGNYEPVLLLPASLAVDNNRDGTISLDVDDQTSSDRPFRFWLNDDDGNGDIGGTDVPGSGSDGTSTATNGAKDIVNYFPVYLNIGQLVQQFPPSGNYTYKLSQADGAVNFLYTVLTLNNPFDYLRPPPPATDDGAPNFQTIGPFTSGFGDDSATDELDVGDQAITEATKHHVTSSGYTLNTNFLNGITTNTTTSLGVILVDGRATTENPLVLTVYNSGNTAVATLSLPLRISNIEDMYRHLNLRTGHDAPGGLLGIRNDDGEPSNYALPGGPPGFPDSVNGSNWIVQMHGYNVSGDRARGWESEVFKELYWSHSQAKFVGVCWFSDPYDYSGEQVPNYQTAVRNAFITAPALKNYVNTRLTGGNITIIAHSLSSIVVSSALEDSGMNITHAIFVDGALAQEAFDGNTDETLGNMTLSSWYNGTTIYDRLLWTTDWFKRFSSFDARNELTWQKRFNGQNGLTPGSTTASKIYNFYSPTENVLATDAFDPSLEAVGLIVDAVVTVGGDVGQNSWVIQEKTKGNQIAVYPLIVSGSTYMGWGFNVVDSYWSSANTTSANSTSLTHAETSPFFNNGYSAPGVHSGPTAWIDDLFASGLGSGAAGANRNQLLAEAVPALSLPIGANPVSAFAPDGFGEPNDRNYNIPLLYADYNQWPRSHLSGSNLPFWYHSDMHDVAYSYLFKFYDQLVYISTN